MQAGGRQGWKDVASLLKTTHFIFTQLTVCVCECLCVCLGVYTCVCHNESDTDRFNRIGILVRFCAATTPLSHLHLHQRLNCVKGSEAEARMTNKS